MDNLVKSNFSLLDLFGIIIPAILLIIGLFILNYNTFIFPANYDDNSKPPPKPITNLQPIIDLVFNPLATEQRTVQTAQKKEIDNSSAKSSIKEDKHYLFSIEKFLNISFFSIFLILVFYTSLYCIGFLIIGLGSSLIDRFLIAKCMDYPYVSMLRVLDDDNSQEGRNRKERHLFRNKVNRALFCNGLLMLVILLRFPNIFLFYGLILLLVIPIGIKSYMKKKFSQKNNYIYLLPISLGLHLIYEKLFRLHGRMHALQPFSKEMASVIKKEFKNIFAIDIQDAQTDAFWLPYCYIHENCPTTLSTILYLRRLYYFARGLCVTFFILFVLTVIARFYYPQSNRLIIIALIYLSLFIFSYMRYFYIYCNTFSKSVFRAFYSHAKQNFDKKTEDQTTPPPETEETISKVNNLFF